ncbi:Uncharacterized protein dnm_028470 [Desulfonema magnum]|uniref:Uncharacterized protein n=1 Tax=Desulfonema magnum TaxID=45655 RepID=A0A975BKJ5_9BACT|nr:Uncharacterized protein dnm_028470 [Desulfonema magnum]
MPGKKPGFFSGMMPLRQRKKPGFSAAHRKKRCIKNFCSGTYLLIITELGEAGKAPYASG